MILSEPERQLLEKLAAEGKPTRLSADELQTARSLETVGVVFMIKNTTDAIITPKGRNVLARKGLGTKPPKRPLGFLE
jgi:hypothetical protein